jgi:DNA mismatch repair ATPase MutS
MDDAYFLQDGLDKLRAILEYLERFRYGKHERLKKLCQPFLNPEQRPSLQLRQLGRIIVAVSLQRNGIIWLILNSVVPWRYYFAWRLGQYKLKIAEVLPIWLDTVFELEALNSLATFSYLNPDYAFPEISPDLTPSKAAPSADNSSIFKVVQAGHPLISEDHKICNDFAFSESGEIVIITGSNMAGKSSFLRTLGVNLCLAYAGSPVNAQSLHTKLFRLFTCIRISDSVTDGFSYFYAEVRRLRELLDEFEDTSQTLPIFFLVDEIFKGTNNRERLIGSRAYLQALVGHNSVGLVSTHDLELVTLADNNAEVKNYHFKEDVAEGRMVFSYKLQMGPSQSTNALKIMEMEGLPVKDFSVH